MQGNLIDDIADAERRIRAHVRETPVVLSRALSADTGAEVWLKCENYQLTGSFKLRGALNALLALPQAMRAGGVVAASSGNHGIAVAHAGAVLGVSVTVLVPEGASTAKRTAMQRLGAMVVSFGTDGLDTEIEARRLARESGRPYISPYNDLTVVAGQGTVSVELRRQLAAVDAIVVAVGGGGLIGGIAADYTNVHPGTRIIGAQPERSRVMAASVAAGHVVEMPSERTLSDGTAGGVEHDAVTFALCRDMVDQWVDVGEDAIASAMRHAIDEEHMLIEGSAGVAVAALRALAPMLAGQRVVVVLCGANVSAATLRSVL